MTDAKIPETNVDISNDAAHLAAKDVQGLSVLQNSNEAET